MRCFGKQLLLAFVAALAASAQTARFNEFFAVKGWEGTIRMRGTHSGSNSHPVMGSDTWTVTYAADFRLKLDKYEPLSMRWTGTPQGSASIEADFRHVILGGCTRRNTLKGAGTPHSHSGPPEGEIYFRPQNKYFFDVNTYDIRATWDQVWTGCPMPVNPTHEVDWYPFGPGPIEIELPLPAAGLILRGSRTVQVGLPFELFSMVTAEKPKMQMTIEWEFRPIAAGEMDEVVVSSAQLEKWRPTAGPSGELGSTVALTARLQKKGGGEPSAKALTFEWEMVHTSREPGWAMNAPLKDAKTDADLRIQPAAGLVVRDPEGQAAVTMPGQYTESTATVGSYDWGAWGRVRVTAIMIDGRRIVGYLEGDEAQSEIRLPRRPDGDLIAKSWREAMGVGSLADTSDDEDAPIGDSNTGDGLTLYEEYRGFIEAGTHIEGDPKRKDYFIYSRAGGAYLMGILRFRTITGLAVHFDFMGSEFPDNRVMNLNHGAGPHRVDQHGVIVFADPALQGYAYAAGGPGNPKMITGVYVPAMPAGMTDAEVAYYNVGLTHELLHASNVWHHGDSYDRPVRWRRDAAAGKVFESEGQGPETEVRVLREDGSLFDPRVPEAGMDVLIGIEGGPHVGPDQCVMRYDVAGGYVSRTAAGLRYRVAEKAGHTICRQSEGTGINEPGRNPQPRYGSSAAQRGACAYQILVNDAVAAPRR